MVAFLLENDKLTIRPHPVLHQDPGKPPR
jgi:hypothetical protein